MPSLNDQLNSFKEKVRSAPVYAKRVVDEQRPVDGDDLKRRKVADASGSLNDTSASSSTLPSPAAVGSIGIHRNTHLVHAIEYLKRTEAPVTLSDLEGYLSTPVGPLVPLMKLNPRIHIDAKNQTATYVSKMGIYTADDLLRFLNSQKVFQGVSVKELKDGWSGCIPTIKRLEEEKKLLVIKNKRDGQPRLVWPSAVQGIGEIDNKFVRLWQQAKVPTASELPRSLERVGLKPSSIDPSQVKQQPRKAAEKQKRRAPRSKITNTHLRGVLRDFS